MAWEGHALRIKDIDEKRATVEEAVAKLLDTARQCRAADLPVNIISCGGTGTYPSRRPSTASPRSKPVAASTAIWCTAARSASTIRWR